MRSLGLGAGLGGPPSTEQVSASCTSESYCCKSQHLVAVDDVGGSVRPNDCSAGHSGESGLT